MSKLFQNIEKKLWAAKPYDKALYNYFLFKILRPLYGVVRDLLQGQISLRAMSLVFTTLLAIVPLLAVSFSVLKGFGVHNQLEPILLQFLQPLGEKGIAISEKIIGFVENIKVGVLGSLGLALLFYSTISLIQKVEYAFNHIWRLQHNRSLLRRFSDYLSILLIGPVLIFSAIGLSASLLNYSFVQTLLAIEPFGFLYKTLIRFTPYLLVISAFTFFYMFIPNTRVRFKAALIGGIVSGVLWQTMGWLFASFVVVSTGYTVIYSSFAVLILFMLWVYLNWLILLLGADLVFYIQNPNNIKLDENIAALSILDAERLMLSILYRIAVNFYTTGGGISISALGKYLGVPNKLLTDSLLVLKKGKLITHDEQDPANYFPAVAFDTIGYTEALEIIRATSREDSNIVFESNVIAIDYIDQHINTPSSDMTLKDFFTRMPNSELYKKV